MGKIVLFTQRVLVKNDYGERWDCTDQKIVTFLHACGFMPVALPNAPKVLPDYFAVLRPSGIVLTGGNSLAKYGGDAPERDEMDTACIQMAIEQGIPVYGFCRGMQSLLDYFGEPLSEVEGHVAVRHVVAGKIRREVNSYHGQACMNLLTNNFIALASTKDGVIEAVQHRSYPFLGTMWHPERETPFEIDDILRIKKCFG